MNAEDRPLLRITEYWQDLTQHLIELVDLVPEGRMNWSPSPEVWNFRGLFLHIAGARHHWLQNAVQDGEESPDIVRRGQTPEGLKDVLRESWERMLRFLSDADTLNKQYVPPPGDPQYVDPATFDGHFIAYHRLVHDVHHQGDILRHFELLGVALPEDRRRRPL
jgi:uncharacterized damage-inducible protein DinB